VKLCFWIPEIEMKSEGQSKGAREGHEHIPRSSRSPSMVTRSVAERRSSELIKQQRSMSNHHSGGAREVRRQLAGGSERGLVLTGIAEAEAIGGTAKGEEATVGLYGADEALEELADVLLDGELFRRGEELHDEIEETL